MSLAKPPPLDADNTPLFRPEVASQTTREPEGIVVWQPRLAGVAVLGSILAVMFIGLVLFLGTYQARVTVTGTLVPSSGVVPVVATVSGVVEQVEVHEGEVVAVNQVLAGVVAAKKDLAGRDVSRELLASIAKRGETVESRHRAQSSILDEQQSSLKKQLKSALLIRAGLLRQRPNRERQAELAERMLSRMRELSSGAYVSEIQLGQAESELIERQAAIESMEQEQLVVEQQILQIQQRLNEIPAQRVSQNAAISGDKEVIEQEAMQSLSSTESAITSPQSGVLASFPVEPGQFLRAGQVVGSIIPKGSTLQARLLLPSRAIGLVRVGDTVRLRYESFPFQKFGLQSGRIVQTSKSPLSQSEMQIAFGESFAGQPSYMAIVEIPHQSFFSREQDYPLIAGMRVEADILLERRTLISWLLVPIESIRSRTF